MHYLVDPSERFLLLLSAVLMDIRSLAFGVIAIVLNIDCAADVL